MSPEPIGLATLALGCLCLALGRSATVIGFCLAALFGAAAATVIGSANIQPGHVFVAFLAASILAGRDGFKQSLGALAPGRPGFWLAGLVAYGVATAFFLPRLLAGTTQIIPLGTSAYADTGFTVPLGPVSSNLTQSVYMSANLAAFALTAAIAATPGGFAALLAGLIAYCAGNVAFALLDIGTYAVGAQDLLGFMRNARYTLHTESEVAGMKRIVGSFTEASSFARSTLGVLGLAGTLWLCGRRPAICGSLAAASLALLLLSTSSTGLVGAPIMLGLLYLTALGRSGAGPAARRSAAAVLLAPPLTALAVIGIALSPEAWDVVRGYVDLVVLDKAGSDSGIERSSWNAVALQNVIDTGGLGVGLGTARASSFAVALLANVGVIGSALYLAFLGSALARVPGPSRTFEADARMAARNGCVGLMVGDLLVSPVVDQGLFFYALAALACARPSSSRPAGHAA